MNRDMVTMKSRQPGLATLAELLRIEADAAPKVCPKKLRLQLSIKAALQGVPLK